MTKEEHAQIFADRLNMLKNDHDLTYRDIERKTGIRHNQLGHALLKACSNTDKLEAF